MFDAARYEVRQRFSLGNRYSVYEDGREEPILTSAQKRFRLREDFRFTDPGTGEERFRVRADSVLDLAATYDVVDSTTNERIGSISRSVTSIFRHEYELLDPAGNTLAIVREDSVLNAIVRRFLTTFLPFSYAIESPDGRVMGRVKETLSLRDKYTVDLDASGNGLDPRLAIIATVVIDAIEEN